MVKNEQLKGKSVTYKKLNYANFFNGINVDYDQFILPVTYSTNTYNFSFNKGALTTGLGVDYVYFPASPLPGNKEFRKVQIGNTYNVKATWLFRKENKNVTSYAPYIYENYLIFQTDEGNFYLLDIASNIDFVLQIGNLNLTEVPVVLNYNLNGEDSILICSPSGMWYWNTTLVNAVKVENAPKIKNMCLHYERIFATIENDRNEIWFSDDLNPTNWNVSLTEAGFIKFSDERGIVNKVVSFNDYVYVFREYGISRLTAYASQEEFSITQLFVSSGKIYGNSVCVCGDRILMLTQNGIYVFDGYSTTKLNLSIDNLIKNAQNQSVCSAYCNGKYYLACNLNFNDNIQIGCENNTNFVNNALLELDLETNTLNIMRGVDIRHLNAVTDDKISKVIACYFENNSFNFGEIGNFGGVYGTSLNKCWKSPLSDCGYPEKQKVVKNIFLKSNVPVKITIRTENATKTYNAKPKNNLIKINTLIKGNLFAIDFETSSAECEISSPSVIVGLVWQILENLLITRLRILKEKTLTQNKIFQTIVFHKI